MLKIFFLILPTIILFATSCDNKTEQKIEQKIDSTELNANNLLIEAQNLIDSGALQQAKLIIDSVHNSFPTLRTQRIKAKSLADSIIYLEAKTTLAGSINMTKAAWENFLTMLASDTDGIDIVAKQLVDSFSNVVHNLMPVIQNLAFQITQALPIILPEVFLFRNNLCLFLFL